MSDAEPDESVDADTVFRPRRRSTSHLEPPASEEPELTEPLEDDTVPGSRRRVARPSHGYAGGHGDAVRDGDADVHRDAVSLHDAGPEEGDRDPDDIDDTVRGSRRPSTLDTAPALNVDEEGITRQRLNLRPDTADASDSTVPRERHTAPRRVATPGRPEQPIYRPRPAVTGPSEPFAPLIARTPQAPVDTLAIARRAASRRRRAILLLVGCMVGIAVLGVAVAALVAGFS